MRVFNNIPVVPTVRQYALGQMAEGGPIWPQFEMRAAIRQKRQGKVADHAPQLPPGPLRRIAEPCVWGGFAIHHFGHLIAENLTRILESLEKRPDDTFLFIGRPDEGAAEVPGFFWSILDWYGLPRDQVMFVTEPLKVAELRVMPQAEQMGFGEPSESYLDLVDRLPARNGLVPVASDILYVSRVGLPQLGKAAHAGESYLVERLKAHGVTVLDPAKAPLLEQLALYAGARTIVFAEGSAMHGRQLLGRLDQRICILKRRPSMALASGMLTKRCTELRYIDAASSFIFATSDKGREFRAKGLSFFDLDAVLGFFQSLGIALEQDWSQDDFTKARDADAFAWFGQTVASAPIAEPSVARIREVFALQGVIA
ncbi:MAG: glycosyltransferase 61 family protein [Cypionkella sp.]